MGRDGIPAADKTRRRKKPATDPRAARDLGDTTALVYDGECPVCSSYVRFLRIRQSVGPVQLINARDGGEIVDRIRTEQLNLDEGMVLLYGGRFYHGSDCIHMLALLSSRSGVFNRCNGLIFSSPRAARMLYPVLRAGRNLLLWLLGRQRLGND